MEDTYTYKSKRTDVENRKTIIYRIMKSITEKIEVAPLEEVEKSLAYIKKDIAFYTCGSRYGSSVEVKFSNKKLDDIGHGLLWFTMTPTNLRHYIFLMRWSVRNMSLNVNISSVEINLVICNV